MIRRATAKGTNIDVDEWGHPLFVVFSPSGPQTDTGNRIAALIDNDDLILDDGATVVVAIEREATALAWRALADIGLRATPDSPRVRAIPGGYVSDPHGSYVILYDPPICACDGEHCGDGPTCQYVDDRCSDCLVGQGFPHRAGCRHSDIKCVCEGEFVWACGPECPCWHHPKP